MKTLKKNLHSYIGYILGSLVAGMKRTDFTNHRLEITFTNDIIPL